jgi:hypothetical protein
VSGLTNLGVLRQAGLFDNDFAQQKARLLR